MTDRRIVAAAVAVVVAPILWNAWSAGRDGWAPEGDSAAIVVRTHDVLSADPPLLGNPTTVGARTGEELHHPGPLEFAVLAVPLRLLGADAHGALLGAALVGAAAVAAIGWLGLRSGGALPAVWLLTGTAALAWSLGDEILHDVYNPHLLLLPYALLLVTAWAAACADRAALPVAVVAASFVAQSHAYYALLAALVGAAVVVATAKSARPPARTWWASAALGVVLWIPPLLAELRSGPSNLAGLLRAGAGVEGDGEAAQGAGFAVARLADTLVRFRWLDRRPGPLELVSRPPAVLQTLAVLAVAGVVALGIRAHRRGRRVAAGLAGAAVVSCVASVVAASRLPGGIPLFEPHSHRHWWVTGALFWVAVGWLVADLTRPWLRRLARPARVAAVGIPLVVAAVAAAWAPTIDHDRGSVSFGAVTHLTAAVADALPGDGPWLVTSSGPQAFLSVQPGVVAGLVLRGFDVRVEAGEGPAMGHHRVVAGPVAGTVLVASGDEPPPVPPGYELVARFDAVADARRTGHDDVVLFERPQQLAVFLSVTAGGG